jgi:predicted GIY-YIG superfamily endonuclease
LIRPACWLYRLYAADDTLLYIGISNRPELRLENHQKHKDWWHEVDTYTTDGYMDRREAEAAEVAAIQAERPLYNVAHNQDDSPERLRARLGAVSDEAKRLGWTWEIKLPVGVTVEPTPKSWFKPLGCSNRAGDQIRINGYLAAIHITKTGRPKVHHLEQIARQAVGLPVVHEDDSYRMERDGLWTQCWGAWGWWMVERRLIPAVVDAFQQANHLDRLRIREVPDAFTCKHQRCMFDRYAQRLNTRRRAA